MNVTGKVTDGWLTGTTGLATDGWLVGLARRRWRELVELVSGIRRRVELMSKVDD